MANRNHTLKWINTLGSNKIAFENGIIDGTKNILEEQSISIKDF